MKNLNNKLVQRIIISLQILYILLYLNLENLNTYKYSFILIESIYIIYNFYAMFKDNVEKSGIIKEG